MVTRCVTQNIMLKMYHWVISFCLHSAKFIVRIPSIKMNFHLINFSGGWNLLEHHFTAEKSLIVKFLAQTKSSIRRRLGNYLLPTALSSNMWNFLIKLRNLRLLNLFCSISSVLEWFYNYALMSFGSIFLVSSTVFIIQCNMSSIHAWMCKG